MSTGNYDGFSATASIHISCNSRRKEYKLWRILWYYYIQKTALVNVKTSQIQTTGCCIHIITVSIFECILSILFSLVLISCILETSVETCKWQLNFKALKIFILEYLRPVCWSCLILQEKLAKFFFFFFKQINELFF